VGDPKIGVWRADDVYEPSVIETVLPARPELLNDTGRAIGSVPEEIDAGGLYCALAKYEHYLRHGFRPFDGDALGLISTGELSCGDRDIRTMSTTQSPWSIASRTGRAFIPAPRIQFKCASSEREALGAVR
jgi:hypothetical protein